MYLPSVFSDIDLKVLSDLMGKHPLGLLMTSGPSGLMASPIPFKYLVDGENSVLVAHLARANPHWKELVNVNDCLVVFQGVEGYVTPSWYPSKGTTHKVVPTWNYEMVQVKGRPQVIDDVEWVKKQVSDLTDFMEQKRQCPWSVSDAPDDFIHSQLKAIIGLQIQITEIKGKWKMSQNRLPEDAQGVVEGLSNLNDPHSNPQMAKIVASKICKK
ncbi:MAG: FMN-binding negative transcriptional regulator [Pseudobdellovibrionaceae bacterium]